MRLLHVVGARPNFMKVAPVMRAFASYSKVEQALVHTGQHYDENMSEIFFKQLNIPKPDINLEVGSSSHAVQTADIMKRFETTVKEYQPDRVLVYGDVNSTVAAAMVCAKMLIPIDHVEAGLRSGDRTMPEEINRIVTDRLANLLFTPSKDGNDNLIKEGVHPEQIHLVGNVMIDTLVYMLDRTNEILFNNRPSRYALVTLHRPSNVDNPKFLKEIMSGLASISKHIPIIFPMHPRTRSRLEQFKIDIPKTKNLHIWEPVGYLEFLRLQRDSELVITDSGGIQEETTYLKIPCLTMRDNTERPSTISQGSNQLISQNVELLQEKVQKILDNPNHNSPVPPLWDGKTSERIAKVIMGQ